MRHHFYPFYLLVLVATLSAGCGLLGGGNVEIDNSGDQVLVVAIDDQTWTLGPGGHERVQIEPGNHLLKVTDPSGEVLLDSVFKVLEGGMVNVANAEYFLWTDLYGDPALRSEKLKEEWVEIDDKTYYGEITALPLNQPYIEKRWDYGLDKNFPEDLLGWRFTADKYLIKTKLFRREGLIAEYNTLSQTQ